MVLLLLFITLIFPPRVQAYLDPGTGSYITQLLIGSLVGGLYLIKVYFSKIVAFIKSLLQKLSRREKPSS
ncbi:MAG TPA: hypothetical protein DIV47_01585 [Candidatus Pacebacteria bacterium]|nr:hypothetical protein [Candidatus Paceibacterota bacterium]